MKPIRSFADMITCGLSPRNGVSRKGIYIKNWVDSPFPPVLFEILDVREKSMRVKNTDNNMELTVPYIGLQHIPAFAGDAVYAPRTWWMSSPSTSNYVQKALGRMA